MTALDKISFVLLTIMIREVFEEIKEKETESTIKKFAADMQVDCCDRCRTAKRPKEFKRCLFEM